MMTMHGMFWRFPGSFSAKSSAGIRPRSAYLKVIGDFARWKDKLVLGCDDSAQKEFLNKRKHKGGIVGPGQSNSNLWFTDPGTPDMLGPNTASGSVWWNDHVVAGEFSESMLFKGWPYRSVWIQNAGIKDNKFVFEVDENGNGSWHPLTTLLVKAGHSVQHQFSSKDKGEWIRVRSGENCQTTVIFNYSDNDERTEKSSAIFRGLAGVENKKLIGGLLYGLGENRRSLGIAAYKFENGTSYEMGYYELDAALNLHAKYDEQTLSFIREGFAIPENVIEIDESSILIIDDKERRWRLPLGQSAYKELTENGYLRICREVSTERDLFHAGGTFYELPAENADGFAKIRPVATHNFRIHDYASYRGLLVMTGLEPTVKKGEHVVVSDDGKMAVWLGNIDDLWKLGKPRGHGGPWCNTPVEAGQAADPYLISHYDKRSLEITHDLDQAVRFRIEADPTGHGPWLSYKEILIEPDQTFNYTFPEGFHARWIRFVTDKDCIATTNLEYY
jgi:hypothetical protein